MVEQNANAEMLARLHKNPENVKNICSVAQQTFGNVLKFSEPTFQYAEPGKSQIIFRFDAHETCEHGVCELVMYAVKTDGTWKLTSMEINKIEHADHSP